MILAKSDGKSLQEHIEDCLVIWNELKHSIPSLPSVSSLDDFFEILYIAILFHDFGKVHPEFQKVLRNQPNYWEQQRHEVYSIAYTNKSPVSKGKLKLIQNIILAHHKTFGELKKKYLSQQELEDEYELFWKDKGLPYHPKDFHKNLGSIDSKVISILISFIQNKLKSQSIQDKMQTIFYKDLENPVESIALKWEEPDYKTPEFLQNLLLWGSLKMCDHYGSAEIREMPELAEKHFNFLNLIDNPYSHQQEAWNKKENTILIAPTGTGKTESALGWLRNCYNNHKGKVFYILPYTASINAMHKRLSQDMEQVEPADAKVIGIQHGKLSHYLASIVESEDYSISLKEKTDIFMKLIHPFRIVTPFQILKYFFGVKGFEIGMVNLSGATLIFDEIHAYDVTTFAQIIVMIQFLVERLKCRIFIMTATMPTFMVMR